MDKKTRWVLSFAVIFFIVNACNIFSIGMDNVDDMVSEVEDLVEQIPVEDIVDKIEAMVTDLPEEIGNIGEEIEALVTDLPSELDDLGEIGDLVDLEGIRDLIEDGLGSGEAPADIPIVEAVNEILIESEDVISYLTSMDFVYVTDFYISQMPINGWTSVEENIINDDSALLFFEKDGLKATVTINFNSADNETSVMIFIQTTE